MEPASHISVKKLGIGRTTTAWGRGAAWAATHQHFTKGPATVLIPRSTSRLMVLLAVTASPGTGQVLQGPEGPVEFIGLERWKASALLDAIQQTAPDQPIHACAATMKGELGFADAGVFGYLASTTSGSERYTVIIGIEDRARVRYRTAGSETIALPQSWQTLRSVADEDLRALGMAREWFDLRQDPETARKFAELFDADLASIEPVWELIAALDGERDRHLARKILADDASWVSRAIAATVLLNFGEDETAWHDLVAATIDPHGQVSGAAASVLRSLARMERGRAVRWDAAREPIAAVLDGTNPFAFQEVVRALTATGIEPALGKQLIREAPDLLLAHVDAEHQSTRESAIDLLKAVSGEDFGADREAWSEWLDGSLDDS